MVHLPQPYRCAARARVIGVNDRQSIAARSVAHRHTYGARESVEKSWTRPNYLILSRRV